MTENTMTVTYGYPAVEISYNEQANVWEFELRNRNRQATSLALAKQAIDTPPKPDKKTFKRIPVFVAYGQNYQKAEITSLTTTRYSGYEAWVTYAEGNMKGKRERKSMYYLFVDNDHNAALIAQGDAVQKEINALQTKRHDLTGKMDKLEINPEDYD